MSEIIKSGNLLKFTNSDSNVNWKFTYVELYKDSTFKWFNNGSDLLSKKSINLKNVSAFLAFGDIINNLPFKPKLIPQEIGLVFAIPHENNRDTRLSFFLCKNDKEIKEWVDNILKTVSGSSVVGPPYSVSSNPQPLINESTTYNSGVPSNQYQISTSAYVPGEPQIKSYNGNQSTLYSQMNLSPPVPFTNPYQSHTPYVAGVPPPNMPFYSSNAISASYQVNANKYPQQSAYVPGANNQPFIGCSNYTPGVPQQTYTYDNHKQRTSKDLFTGAAIGLAVGAVSAVGAYNVFGNRCTDPFYSSHFSSCSSSSSDSFSD